MDEILEDRSSAKSGGYGLNLQKIWVLYVIVALFASAVFLGCIVSPPSLMDDVDATQAQIARNMIQDGDWVTGHLDNVVFLDRSPLIYWTMAISYEIFGIRDWAARLPQALTGVALCCMMCGFGIWAFGKLEGLYTGLILATCIGLFLFTRILNADLHLTLTIALSMWALLRVLDEEEANPRTWAAILAVSLAIGLLLKSLIALIFPLGAAFVYLLITRQLFERRTWQRLHVWSGLAIILVIALPWHILATIRNPPYFAWTIHAGPGQYHGFLWFYLINEQVLRFFNLRYPHDYNTVPRLSFWLLHFVWLFPWSVYLPAVAKLSFKPTDRAGQTRLLALCWIGFMLVFFTFSTTQEYYSMPAYPAFALLLASAMVAGGSWVRGGTRVLAAVALVAGIACFAIFIGVRNVPTPGDIASALTHNPKVYSFSLGHMEDLTFQSFAYLRMPLVVAGIAFLGGALGILLTTGKRSFIATALMMVLFFHAARLALVVFDPYLTSRPLANALLAAPQGDLIIDHPYYTYSSVFFYTDKTALILNGRYNNLEYGSYAPGTPDIFIDDPKFKSLWAEPKRYYVITTKRDVTRMHTLIAPERYNIFAESGGKLILTNQPVTAPSAAQ